MAARKKATKQAAPTAYVVLEAIELTQEFLPKKLADREYMGGVIWAPVLNQTVEQGPDGQPRIFTAANKSAAIRQHTGSGESVLSGTWKAIPWSSWKGGETTRTKVTAERLPFEEGV
jgi:hypothetical protein